jgi:NAD(P)H-hydrate epimerase
MNINKLVRIGRLLRTSYIIKERGMAGTGSQVSYHGQEDSQKIDNCLFFEYQYSIDQLMEIAGLCCAQALARVYPVSHHSKVLVVCGPGNNGGDGLVAARHLLSFGYTVNILYPKRTSKPIYDILVTQCEKLHIPFLPELPSSSGDIDSQYDVVLDAIFGFSFKGSLRPPFDSILPILKDCQTPICSVDVPSGWDVEKGNVNDFGLNPQVLVSLTCPKLCAKSFVGRHFLGLRIVPHDVAVRFGITLPPYPGTDQIVEL